MSGSGRQQKQVPAFGIVADAGVRWWEGAFRAAPRASWLPPARRDRVSLLPVAPAEARRRPTRWALKLPATTAVTPLLVVLLLPFCLPFAPNQRPRSSACWRGDVNLTRCRADRRSPRCARSRLWSTAKGAVPLPLQRAVTPSLEWGGLVRSLPLHRQRLTPSLLLVLQRRLTPSSLLVLRWQLTPSPFPLAG